MVASQTFSYVPPSFLMVEHRSESYGVLICLIERTYRICDVVMILTWLEYYVMISYDMCSISQKVLWLL